MIEQWKEIKETVIELRDNNGTGTQQEVCKFLANLMDILEKQMNDGWIPVSERLPKVADCYAVTRQIGSDLIVGVCYFDGTNTWHNDNYINHERNYLTNIVAWMPLPEPYKTESEDKTMTYGDIYDEFCKKFPNAEVEDYRPAVEMHIPQLSRGIPNAIIVWIRDGSKVIYIAESEDK